MKIARVFARQILDSRGIPTLEAEVTLENGVIGRSAVPSGTSSGAHEAVELRDGGVEYQGKGVAKALANVNGTIAQALANQDFDQTSLDQTLIQLDGTENKSALGANAILSVSLAFAWAVSRAENLALYEYIGRLFGNTNFLLPRPMFNVLNGGAHANWATDFQEYMIVPSADKSWAEKLRMGVEIYHSLSAILKEKNLATLVGHEGGFSPQVQSNEENFELLVQAVTKAGYSLGMDAQFAIDAAASEFYQKDTNSYALKRDGKTRTTAEMIDWLAELAQRYPLVSLEDPLAEDDWAGWTALTETLAGKQIVGDDLLTTNSSRIQQAIDAKACNALLVKPNQIGSLTETLAAMKLAQSAGWNCVISHRSGDTEDVTIAHLAVGTGCGQIKTGAPARTERTAKYNELTRIAERVEHA